MVSIRAAGACALIAVSATLHAEPAPVPPAEMAVYEKGFTAVQQGTRSFRAELRQTLHLQGLAQPIVSLGTLYYETPDRLYIRFSQPAGEWMRVSGTRLAIQKQGQPLQRRDLSAQGKFPSHAASLLDFFHSDAAHWDRDFDVTMARAGDRLFVTLKPYLTPTAASQGVEQIVTTLRLPAYDIVGMEVTINSSNRIDYEFIDGQRNASIDPALFRIPGEPKP
jgi:outer membrane lipoprotein-sorting protein